MEGTDAGGTVFAVGSGNATRLSAGMPSGPAVPAGWVTPTHYGYPLVGLVYTPYMAPPTITPTCAPQNTLADFGGNDTEIHGMIYSGGHVQFNRLTLDGGVVAFEIQTHGSAAYIYNGWYGYDTPPPGFPFGAGNRVVIVRKSFVVCTNWSDDSGGPTGCN